MENYSSIYSSDDNKYTTTTTTIRLYVESKKSHDIILFIFTAVGIGGKTQTGDVLWVVVILTYHSMVLPILLVFYA